MADITLPRSQWYEKFVTSLEYHGATTRQISDAVATVHAHCLEANRPPEDVFGEPNEYAGHLAGQYPSKGSRHWTTTLLGSFMAVGFLLPSAVKAATHEHATVSWYFAGVALLVLLPPLLRTSFARHDLSPRTCIIATLIPTAAALYALFRVGLDRPAPMWFWLPVLVIALVLLPVSLKNSRAEMIKDPATGRAFDLGANQLTRFMPWLIGGLSAYLLVMWLSMTLS